MIGFDQEALDLSDSEFEISAITNDDNVEEIITSAKNELMEGHRPSAQILCMCVLNYLNTQVAQFKDILIRQIESVGAMEKMHPTAEVLSANLSQYMRDCALRERALRIFDQTGPVGEEEVDDFSDDVSIEEDIAQYNLDQTGPVGEEEVDEEGEMELLEKLDEAELRDACPMPTEESPAPTPAPERRKRVGLTKEEVEALLGPATDALNMCIEKMH